MTDPAQPAPAVPDVSIIVVGLNASHFVEQCFTTVKAATWNGVTYDMVYVDNGSKDDTLAMMARVHPDVRVIANATNTGFCKAANQGAAASAGRHLCFLNDDVIVLDDAIARTVHGLDADPGVGVIGLRLLNLDRTDQWAGRRFPTMLNGLFARRSPIARFFPKAGPLRRYLYQDEIARGEPFDADWVSAAGLTVRRDVFDGAGRFDESYYYWHEAVFCSRVTARGHRVLLDPGARIIHYEGQGSGKRGYAARRWHVRDFHAGAYRAYVEEIKAPAGPGLRAVAWTLLQSRKALLLGLITLAEVAEGARRRIAPR